MATNAAGKAAGRAATGIVGKAASTALRRSSAKVAGRTGSRTAARTGSKSAAKKSLPSPSRARTQAARNDSGLPVRPSTAEARRAYDKLHRAEPKWGPLTERYHGPAPAGMIKPHGHHIVFKEGNRRARAALQESKQILERNGIDWYTGPENLIWAPNRAHTAANAQRVLDALRAADGQGRQAVVDALRGAGRSVFGGQP